jgi:hypothetical protein
MQAWHVVFINTSTCCIVVSIIREVVKVGIGLVVVQLACLRVLSSYSAVHRNVQASGTRGARTSGQTSCRRGTYEIIVTGRGARGIGRVYVVVEKQVVVIGRRGLARIVNWLIVQVEKKVGIGRRRRLTMRSPGHVDRKEVPAMRARLVGVASRGECS